MGNAGGARKVLTDRAVEAIKPPQDKDRIEHWDAALPGLGLRVTRNGVKSWVLLHRVNGKLERLTIGRYPAVGLAAARELGRAAVQKAAKGISAAAEKRQGRDERKAAAALTSDGWPRDSFGTLAERYIRQDLKGLRRGWEVERIVRRELLPHWGNRPLAELRRRDAIERIDALVDAGKPQAADRLHQIIKRIGNFAVEKDVLEVNPFSSLASPLREKVKRDRVLAEAEVRALWAAWNRMGAFGAHQRLLLLLGQRRDEVAGMRWGDLDLDGKVWTLPRELTKVDRAHVVPLTDRAVSIIRSMMVAADDGELKPFNATYVFSTAPDGNSISGHSKAKSRADRLAARWLAGKSLDAVDDEEGEPIEALPDWRLHDLRRTAATWMAELGVSNLVVGRVLNHAPAGITATVYNRYEYLDEKRDALERLDRKVMSVVNPAPANVVRLAERAAG